MTERWHVAQTKPRHEFIAKMNLKEVGFDTFLPTLERRRSVGRRAADLIEPLFPGYLFVAFNPQVAQWRDINGVRGITRLLCHGDRPDPIPQGVIERLQEKANQDGLIIADERPDSIVRYAAGQWLRLTGGPFAGHSVMVAEQFDGKGRVAILLSLLGSSRMLKVPVEHVLAPT